MTLPQILIDLQAVFDEVFLEPVVLTPGLSASEVPEWDSLIHISLVLAVEKKFGIRFRVGEVENTSTVGEFAELILKRTLER